MARKAGPKREKPKRGQPPKLTPTLAAAICKLLERGASMPAACAELGLSYAVAKEWIQRGRGLHPTRPKTPMLAAFAASTDLAKDRSELPLLEVVRSHALGRPHVIEEELYKVNKKGERKLALVKVKRETRSDLRAAIELLRARFPEHYMPRAHVEHSGEVGVKRCVGVGELLADLLAGPPEKAEPAETEGDDA